MVLRHQGVACGRDLNASHRIRAVDAYFFIWHADCPANHSLHDVPALKTPDLACVLHFIAQVQRIAHLDADPAGQIGDRLSGDICAR